MPITPKPFPFGLASETLPEIFVLDCSFPVPLELGSPLALPPLPPVPLPPAPPAAPPDLLLGLILVPPPANWSKLYWSNSDCSVEGLSNKLFGSPEHASMLNIKALIFSTSVNSFVTKLFKNPMIVCKSWFICFNLFKKNKNPFSFIISCNVSDTVVVTPTVVTKLGIGIPKKNFLRIQNIFTNNKNKK